jgi:Ni2+-binding GTPase involved in maturation of urease and hydrogenase
MMVVVLGTPSSGGTSLMRATVPAQRSPRLGELMVTVGWVSGREEDHAITVAKRHEL